MDQRIEQVGDKVKQLTPTRMLRSKVANLTLMTCSVGLIWVMIILLSSGMLASPRENVKNQDFCTTVVNGDVYGCVIRIRLSSNGHWSINCPLDFPVNLGGLETNENVENQEFGRDINRLDYFRVTPFDPLHGDDSNIGGIANGGGAGEASTSGITVNQTFNHESANTVGIPSITGQVQGKTSNKRKTEEHPGGLPSGRAYRADGGPPRCSSVFRFFEVQALEEKLAKYKEERERREQEFQTELKAERKRRADMEARQQEAASQLAQQTTLLEQIFAFIRQYLSGNPPPPPPPQ